jgi:hypothetical protein
MDRTTGLVASILLCATLGLFALSMAVGLPALSYGASLALSFCYVVVAASLVAEAADNRRGIALAGLAFAAMYASVIATVYFVQLTTVAHGSAGVDVLKALSYNELGSLMFNLDLLGYGLMSLSTLFVGLSMSPRGRGDTILRLLLIVHGVFAPVCVLLPILDVFGTMARGSGNTVGVMVLFFWCVYFAPVAGLSVIHFRASQRLPS